MVSGSASGSASLTPFLSLIKMSLSILYKCIGLGCTHTFASNTTHGLHNLVNHLNKCDRPGMEDFRRQGDPSSGSALGAQIGSRTCPARFCKNCRKFCEIAGPIQSKNWNAKDSCHVKCRPGSTRNGDDNCSLSSLSSLVEEGGQGTRLFSALDKYRTMAPGVGNGSGVGALGASSSSSSSVAVGRGRRGRAPAKGSDGFGALSLAVDLSDDQQDDDTTLLSQPKKKKRPGSLASSSRRSSGRSSRASSLARNLAVANSNEGEMSQGRRLLTTKAVHELTGAVQRALEGVRSQDNAAQVAAGKQILSFDFNNVVQDSTNKGAESELPYGDEGLEGPAQETRRSAFRQLRTLELVATAMAQGRMNVATSLITQDCRVVTDLEPEAVQQLPIQFPDQPRPQFPPPGSEERAGLHIELHHFLQAVSKYPEGKAAGLSGMKMAVLKTIFSVIKGIEPMEAIWEEFFNALVQNSFCSEFNQLFTAQRGVVLAEDKGPGLPVKYRFICVSEAFVLIAQAGLKHYLEHTEDAAGATYQRAIQAVANCGAGQSHGALVCANTAAAFLQKHPDGFIIALDQSNAFGLVDRMAIFDGCRELGLSFLLPVIRLIYDHDFTISFSSLDTEVKATTGVAQGSTFSSLFYCIGQWWLLKKFRKKHINNRKAALFSFIDDNHLGITGCEDAKEAIVDFRDGMAAGGGKLNLAKLKVLPGSSALDPAKSVVVKALKELGMPPDKAKEAIVDGLMITGIPVGSDAFVKEACSRHCDKVTKVLGWLRDTVKGTEHLDFSQTIVHRVFATIKHCVIPMSDFMLRSVERDLCRRYAVHVDTATMQALLDIIKCRIEDKCVLAKTAHKVFIKSSCGGLGFRSMALMTDLSAVFSKMQSLLVAAQASPWLFLTRSKTAHEPYGSASSAAASVAAVAAVASGPPSTSSSSATASSAGPQAGESGSKTSLSSSLGTSALGTGVSAGTGSLQTGKSEKGAAFLVDTAGKRALFEQASRIREGKTPADLQSQSASSLSLDLGAVGSCLLIHAWARRGPDMDAAGPGSRSDRQQSSVLGGSDDLANGATSLLSLTNLNLDGDEGDENQAFGMASSSSSSSSDNLPSSIAALFDAFPAGPQEPPSIDDGYFNWRLFPALLRHITTLCGSSAYPTALGRLDLNTFHLLSPKDIDKLKKKCLEELLVYQRGCVSWMLANGEERTVFASGCGSEAASYLDSIPAPHSQRGRTDVAPAIDNDLFIDSVRERLYLDRFSPPPGSLAAAGLVTHWDCPGCGMKGVMDCKGTHIGGCSAEAGFRQLRHDVLCGRVVAAYRRLNTMEASGGRVSGETPLYKIGLIVRPNARYRLDWCWEPWPSYPHKYEEMHMGDITVTSPVAVLEGTRQHFVDMMGPTVFDDKGRILKGAGRPMGAAAALGVTRKKKHYTNLVGKDVAGLVSCVSFEPYGMVSAEGAKLCLSIAKRMVKLNSDKREGLKADLQQRIAGGQGEEDSDGQLDAAPSSSSAAEAMQASSSSSSAAAASASSSSSSSFSSSSDNAATSQSAGGASSSAGPSSNGSSSKTKTMLGKAGSLRLIKQMSISVVYRRLITNLVTTLRHSHARMFTNYYRKYNLQGGNRWVIMKEEGDHHGGRLPREEAQDGRVPA